MTMYENFNELKEDYEKLAKKLLSEVGKGDWMDEELYLYPSLSEYAEYELTEGWYIDCGFDRMDFNGAPNPIDYIDLEAFGEALSNRWDDSCYWTDGEYVISTGVGW